MDKEQVLAAANAAGLEIEWHLDRPWVGSGDAFNTLEQWEPKANLAQSLRLAVRCDMCIDVCRECGNVTARIRHHEVLAEKSLDDFHGDAELATMAAIFACAIEKGKREKQP